MNTIYLDNGATSFPKPPAVAQAMLQYMTEVGASINRGVYGSAQAAGMTTLLLREGLCRLFHHSDPTHCVLTPGNTAGLSKSVLPSHICAQTHSDGFRNRRAPLLQFRQSLTPFR